MTTKTCPLCKSPTQIYHDAAGRAYYTRHTGAAGRWCKSSSKPVTRQRKVNKQ